MDIPAPDSVLLITLDSCRYDTYRRAKTPHLDRVAPVHKAKAPSYFTYGSHSAMWMGFTPGIRRPIPWLNPKAGKLFRMSYMGSGGRDEHGFSLEGRNIIEGFRRLGYYTLGSGAVDWFDTSTPTGSVLAESFDDFFFAGNTWSLDRQLKWVNQKVSALTMSRPVFLFLNIGETHVPYWHSDAEWDPFPSPCVPFAIEPCSRRESRRRQKACLEWVDRKLADLLQAWSASTIMVCADHGDCWGENGLWEHGISHWATLTVPLLLRVRGAPIS